jgi:hypothetical protein
MAERIQALAPCCRQDRDTLRARADSAKYCGTVDIIQFSLLVNLLIAEHAESTTRWGSFEEKPVSRINDDPHTNPPEHSRDGYDAREAPSR